VSTKVDRDFVAADLATVDRLLKSMTGKDVIAKLSLQSRRDELVKNLAQLADVREVSASASLFFAGEPVRADQGIEVSFGAQAMEKFQEVVTRVFAFQHTGSLGQRGAVPGKDATRLHLTNVVRGSFGFRLEEMPSQSALLESPLKDAMDEATRLIANFGLGDEEAFESEVENLDSRVLTSIRDFFGLLNDRQATFRLVSGTSDKSFHAQTIARAAERAKITKLDEEEIELPGQLAGALRDSRIFEFRPEDGRPALKGPIGAELSADTISKINREFSDKDSLGKFRVKSVRQDDRLLRQKFTLLSIRGR
jgi:hypothetical protein